MDVHRALEARREELFRQLQVNPKSAMNQTAPERQPVEVLVIDRVEKPSYD